VHKIREEEHAQMKNNLTNWFESVKEDYSLSMARAPEMATVAGCRGRHTAL